MTSLAMRLLLSCTCFACKIEELCKLAIPVISIAHVGAVC